MSRSILRLILSPVLSNADDERGCYPESPARDNRGPARDDRCCVPPAPGSGDRGCYPPKPSVAVPSRLARSRRSESRRA
jgi:hypothetical protein